MNLATASAAEGNLGMTRFRELELSTGSGIDSSAIHVQASMKKGGNRVKIERDDDFGGAVLNCAVRYALGRFSYMPGLVMDEIRPMLKDCSDKTLWCFDRDIGEWLAGRTGEMYAYEKEWASFREEVRRIMQERKVESGS